MKKNETKIQKAGRVTKTNHGTGYHKPCHNPSTNYGLDSHKQFCKRCKSNNQGLCPATGTTVCKPGCNL